MKVFILRWTLGLFFHLLNKTMPKCRCCKYFCDPGIYRWDGNYYCMMCGAGDKQPLGFIKKLWLTITFEHKRWKWTRLT